MSVTPLHCLPRRLPPHHLVITWRDHSHHHRTGWHTNPAVTHTHTRAHTHTHTHTHTHKHTHTGAVPDASVTVPKNSFFFGRCRPNCLLAQGERLRVSRTRLCRVYSLFSSRFLKNNLKIFLVRTVLSYSKQICIARFVNLAIYMSIRKSNLFFSLRPYYAWTVVYVHLDDNLLENRMSVSIAQCTINVWKGLRQPRWSPFVHLNLNLK